MADLKSDVSAAEAQARADAVKVLSTGESKLVTLVKAHLALTHTAVFVLGAIAWHFVSKHL